MLKFITLIKIQFRKNKSELFVIFAFSLALFVSGALISASFSYLGRIESFENDFLGDENGLYFCMFGVDEVGSKELIDSFEMIEYVKKVNYIEVVVDNASGEVNAILLDKNVYDVFDYNSFFPRISAASSSPTFFELLQTESTYPVFIRSEYNITPNETIKILPFGFVFFDANADTAQIEALTAKYQDCIVFMDFDELITGTENTMKYAKRQSLFFPCLIFIVSIVFIIAVFIIYADRTLECAAVIRCLGLSKLRSTFVILTGFSIPLYAAFIIAFAYILKNCCKKGTQFFWEYAYPNYRTLIFIGLLSLVVVFLFALYLYLFILNNEVSDIRKKVLKR